MLYTAHEMVKVLEYLKERKELFYKLLHEHDDLEFDRNYIGFKGSIAIRVLKLAMDYDELINSFTIAEILFPAVKKMPDYPYASFDEWKKNYSQQEILLKSESL